MAKDPKGNSKGTAGRAVGGGNSGGTPPKPANAETKPAAKEPAAAKPATAKAAPAKPAAAKPAAASAASQKPAEVKPAATKPTAAKPAESKPAAPKPAALKPAAAKPAAPKPTAPPPAASKPAASTPAVPTPTAAKPTAPAPAAPKPAAPAPAVAKPAAPKATPPKPLPPLADAAQVAAVVQADHADPFGFLGMHKLTDDALVVRAFLPQATAAAVVDAASGREVAKLESLDAAGFYAGAIRDRAAPFAYRLKLQTADGPVEVGDAYRFPPVVDAATAAGLAAGDFWRSYKVLGAQVTTVDGVAGVSFAVWAPDAARVSVVGDFNGWDGRRHGMRLHHDCGVWDIFIPGVKPGAHYKYEIKTAPGAQPMEKPDPCGFQAERWPGSASLVCDLNTYRWNDAAWMKSRAARGEREAPISVYEVHPGSWRRVPEEDARWQNYREMAETLPDYVRELGFTHVQFMPLSEHDFEGSWGYHPTALYAPTGRYGSPDDLRYLIDTLHQAGIGVILDWVPTQFADEPNGFGAFDGAVLYEHPDPQQQRHARSGLFAYDYGRPQVSNFLIANALYWIDRFHVDGLRVGDLSPILYLDYDRGPGEWSHNRFGGHENLEAVDFLRRLNEVVYAEQPGAFTIAEETSAWPMVSRPTFLGGLGFGYVWNRRVIDEILHYLGRQPIHRKYYHEELTHGPAYMFQENYMTALSHELVVHGRGPLIARMPGNHWDKFAHLRLFYVLLFMNPGKKLVFMGDEFAQWREWNHEMSLDWHLLDDPLHRGVHTLISDLNALYASVPALHELDGEPEGFEWIDCNDTEQSVLSWLRFDRQRERVVAAVCNFTPVVRRDYRIGVPAGGRWLEALNTDSERYGGGNVGNAGGVDTMEEGAHGRPFSLGLTLPPYAAVVLVRDTPQK